MYDVRRDVDIIHCARDTPGFSFDKTRVLVYSPNTWNRLPWNYAVVLGVYHAQVLLPDSSERRMEFLWVRWFERDTSISVGPSVRRLERLKIMALDSPHATGFVDPAAVIRGCHIVPAFYYGRATLSIQHSLIAHHTGGDWSYYYMNRYVCYI